MRILLILSTFAVVLFAGGCATFKPVPYQPSVDGGYGYSEQRLGPGEYRITVSGNAATSAERLWDYALLRAAEITLADGHKYFIVAPNAAGELLNIKPAFLTPQFGIGPGAGLGVRVPLFRYEGLPVGVEPSRQLIATATIATAKQMRGGAENVFDAQALRDKLRSQIVSPHR